MISENFIWKRRAVFMTSLFTAKKNRRKTLFEWGYTLQKKMSKCRKFNATFQMHCSRKQNDIYTRVVYCTMQIHTQTQLIISKLPHIAVPIRHVGDACLWANMNVKWRMSVPAWIPAPPPSPSCRFYIMHSESLPRRVDGHVISGFSPSFSVRFLGCVSYTAQQNKELFIPRKKAGLPLSLSWYI